jgi:hypothetical protein
VQNFFVQVIVSPFLEKMCKAMCEWLEEETQKRLTVSGNVVREKAIQFFKHYGGSGHEVKSSFIANKGHNESLKKQISLHNVKTTRETVSVEHVAGSKYPELFKKTLVGRGERTTYQRIASDLRR